MKDFAKSISFSRHIASLDILRVFAIFLISIQHGFSVLGKEELTRFNDLSIGQYGVSIFCVLSGFLALRGSKTASEWIKRRLITIFPAYWIALLISFLLTWISGYKQFDLGLFISQMLGLGFFTHGWNLVNVASWFISLILLCYGLVFIAKMSRSPELVMIFWGIIAIALIGSNVEITMSRHIISFCAAAIGGYLLKRFSPIFLSILIFPLGLCIFISPQYSFSVLALFLLMLSLLLPDLKIKGVRKLSPYIYEYFLIHGIFFVGVVEIFGDTMPGLTIIFAVTLSVCASWLLKYVVNYLMRQLNSMPR